MNQFIEVARMIANLLPVIIQIIRAIEEQVPESGKGAEKLGLARELIQVAYDSATDLSASFDEIWPMVNKIIDRLVATFNRLGIFAKKA